MDGTYLYDTHAHLDDEMFDDDRAAVIEKIRNSGVGRLNNIGSDMQSSRISIGLAEKYHFIYAAVGVHPSETGGMTDADIDELRRMAAHKKVIAIGEIGLDYLDMPVVIHDRESKGECMEILKEKGISNGVIHCFSGSAETAAEFLKMGFHISFTGVLTFKNAKKAIRALEAIPMERLLIETDCPYMAPEPFRGTRNDSSLVYRVAEKIAEVKGVSVEDTVRITCENALRLFKVGE